MRGQEGHGRSRDQGGEWHGRSAAPGPEAAATPAACPMGGGLQGLMAGHREPNVGDVERVLSVMGGGLLALFGATRGGLTGLGLAALGGGLVYRGVTGHCEAYHGLGINTRDEEQGRKPAREGAYI